MSNKPHIFDNAFQTPRIFCFNTVQETYFFDFGTLYIVFLTEILSFGVIRNPVKF